VIIHISSERFRSVLSYGYPLSGPPQGMELKAAHVASDHYRGDNLYHILAEERAYCAECDGAFESVEAWTPAELEIAKLKIGAA
jgi:hypothetical protein